VCGASVNSITSLQDVLWPLREAGLDVALPEIGRRCDGWAEQPKSIEHAIFIRVCEVEERGPDSTVIRLVDTHKTMRRGVVEEAGCYVGDVLVPVVVLAPKVGCWPYDTDTICAVAS
jgi:hypothetical protein